MRQPKIGIRHKFYNNHEKQNGFNRMWENNWAKSEE